MRTATAGELTALVAKDHEHWLRVEVADHLGTMQPWTDWVRNWSISCDKDTLIPSAEIQLAREKDGVTVAPLMRDPVPIEEGRRITLDVAVLALGATPGASDWQRLFDGRIDDTEWGSDVLSLPCRGPGRRLHEAWLETESQRGASAGQPVAELMQELLDAVLGVGEETLVVEGIPDWGIVEYTQQRMRLAEALQALAETQGWELVYLWDDTASDFRLTYREPDADITTPMHTFGPGDYYVVPDVRRSSIGRRTVVRVQWDATNEVVVEDTAAIAQPGIGRRPIFLDAAEDGQINSEARALVIAGGALRDLAQPALQQGVEHPLFWPVEVGDYYRWSANGVHYAAAQDMAVTAYEHRGDNSEAPFSTTIYASGKPAGGTYRWYKRTVIDRNARNTRERIRDGDVSTPPTVGGSVTGIVDKDTGAVSAQLLGFPLTKSWKVLAKAGTPPTKAEIEAGAALNGTDILSGTVGTLVTLTHGQYAFIGAIAYGEVDAGGKESPVIADTVAWGVGTTQIAPASVVASKLLKGAQQFSSDIIFASNTAGTVTWTAGNVRTADGASVAVNSGNTGSMPTSPSTYIYFNGSATLQTTTDYTAAVSGDDNLIMCVARGASAAGEEAFYVPAPGALAGGVKIGSRELSDESITTPKLVAGAVTAVKITSISLSTLQAAVGTLAELADDAGIIVSGKLQNAAGTQFLDLDASGSGPFLSHPGMTLSANGDAEFAGTVTANRFTAATITVGPGGTNNVVIDAPDSAILFSGMSLPNGTRYGTSGIDATGSVDILLQPGSSGGRVNLSTATAGTAGSIAEYVHVKINGTERKLAVYAVS